MTKVTVIQSQPIPTPPPEIRVDGVHFGVCNNRSGTLVIDLPGGRVVELSSEDIRAIAKHLDNLYP